MKPPMNPYPQPQGLHFQSSKNFGSCNDSCVTPIGVTFLSLEEGMTFTTFFRAFDCLHLESQCHQQSPLSMSALPSGCLVLKDTQQLSCETCLRLGYDSLGRTIKLKQEEDSPADIDTSSLLKQINMAEAKFNDLQLSFNEVVVSLNEAKVYKQEQQGRTHSLRAQLIRFQKEASVTRDLKKAHSIIAERKGVLVTSEKVECLDQIMTYLLPRLDKFYPDEPEKALVFSAYLKATLEVIEGGKNKHGDLRGKKKITIDPAVPACANITCPSIAK
jgi:hypothetical protein